MKLSPRQQDVLEELKKGRSNEEIARALDISENTVQQHLTKLYLKMGVRNRTQAALRACRLDDLEPGSEETCMAY